MSDNVRDARAALEGVLRRVVGRFAVSTSIVQLAGTRPIPDAKVYAEWLRALVYKHNAKLSSQDLELLGNPPGIKHGIPVRNPHASFAKGEAFAFLKAAFHKLAPPPTQAELEQMANIRPNEFKTKDGRLKSNAPMMTGCHTSWFQLGDSKQAEIAKRMFEATRSNDNRMWEDAVAEIEFVTAPPDAPLAPAPAPGAVAPGIANPAGGSASDGTDVEEESELSTEQNRVGPSRPEKRRAKERLALVSYATAMAGTEQDDPNFRESDPESDDDSSEESRESTKRQYVANTNAAGAGAAGAVAAHAQGQSTRQGPAGPIAKKRRRRLFAPRWSPTSPAQPSVPAAPVDAPPATPPARVASPPPIAAAVSVDAPAAVPGPFAPAPAAAIGAFSVEEEHSRLLIKKLSREQDRYAALVKEVQAALQRAAAAEATAADARGKELAAQQRAAAAEAAATEAEDKAQAAQQRAAAAEAAAADAGDKTKQYRRKLQRAREQLEEATSARLGGAEGGQGL